MRAFRTRPKVKGLLRLLAEYESPLTADFQRVYGLRLRDAVLERTTDEIGDLILWLPPESSFPVRYRAKNLEDGLARWAWPVDHELMVHVLNLLMTQTHVIQQVNSAKKLKPPTLIDVSREGQKPSRSRPDADSTARALIAEAKARRRGS